MGACGVQGGCGAQVEVAQELHVTAALLLAVQEVDVLPHALDICRPLATFHVSDRWAS